MSLLEEAYRKYTQVDIPVIDAVPVGPNPSPTVKPQEGIEEAQEQSVQSVDMLARELIQKRRDELRRKAGDRWQWIGEDPDNLLAFANHEARRQIEESGNIPTEYDGTTQCRKCGPVPFYRGFERRVMRCCPWCFEDRSPPVPGQEQ